MKNKLESIPDILDDGFQQLTIPLRNDYEGKVMATLVRKLAEDKTDKAVLYIHGFNDYFFQKEMAYKFIGQNINFYALDLRKYGRSYRPHQKFNDIRNIKDYYEDISSALKIIHKDNCHVILFGHSTGGLIVTLFAKDNHQSNLFDAIILNSPFFEFNLPGYMKRLLPVISFCGKYFPKIKIPGGFTEKYGKSLHRDFYGEWDYNLNLKPHIPPKVNMGWIRAIFIGQQELKENIQPGAPCLILRSAKSIKDTADKEQIMTGDVILNVNDIERIALNIKGDIKIESVSGGIHDLILSRKTIRDNVYNIIFNWIKTINFI